MGSNPERILSLMEAMMTKDAINIVRKIGAYLHMSRIIVCDKVYLFQADIEIIGLMKLGDVQLLTFPYIEKYPDTINYILKRSKEL